MIYINKLLLCSKIQKFWEWNIEYLVTEHACLELSLSLLHTDTVTNLFSSLLAKPWNPYISLLISHQNTHWNKPWKSKTLNTYVYSPKFTQPFILYFRPLSTLGVRLVRGMEK